MAQLTPQEKKRRSYAKDRRNTYGENSKSSRKAIPERKRQRSRAERRVEQQILPHALAAEDLLADDSVENRIAASHGKRQGWQKSPDQPLGVVWKRKAARSQKNA